MTDRRPDAAPTPGGDELADDGEGPTFEAPWQARAFAVAVALTDRDDLEWETFQSGLVAEVDAEESVDDRRSPEETYYRQWLRALERVLVERGYADADAIRERAAEFQRGDRDASEFVEGDPHDHSHGHSHDHSHGHSHDHSHDH